ncbi:hypothetical protein bsdE14_34840 [Clostridium omnivorum]|uniref:Uncharacterized protein n=1 Tax=Clostridium omnivorum TaxID=1604902 RepID=A0ABQ5NA48_9CLOT|nr:hypothetical protein bsdE14_34840 [Clostridium sp. E14]
MQNINERNTTLFVNFILKSSKFHMFLTYYLKQVLIFVQDCVQIEVEGVYTTDYLS